MVKRTQVGGDAGVHRRMNANSRKVLNEVKKKVKNRLTGDNQYKNDDQVIDDALELLYLQFKKEKLV